jgi:hypothetical protein
MLKTIHFGDLRFHVELCIYFTGDAQLCNSMPFHYFSFLCPGYIQRWSHSDIYCMNSKNCNRIFDNVILRTVQFTKSDGSFIRSVFTTLSIRYLFFDFIEFYLDFLPNLYHNVRTFLTLCRIVIIVNSPSLTNCVTCLQCCYLCWNIQSKGVLNMVLV